MSYFVTVAWQRGYLTEAERDEYHSLSHRVGLSMDHDLFTTDMIREGTEAILYVFRALGIIIRQILILILERRAITNNASLSRAPTEIAISSTTLRTRSFLLH
jgi:hypothetical protein